MPTTGHEDEFRGIFAEEAEQRLHDLTSQLLALENATHDGDLLASIFREAHTLKGAAAVVGVEEVALVAHAMEDLLEELRSGRRTATPNLIDGLLATVDGLRDMLPGIVAGEVLLDRARAMEASLLAAVETSEDDGAATDDGAEPDLESSEPSATTAGSARSTTALSPMTDDAALVEQSPVDASIVDTATIDVSAASASSVRSVDVAETARVPLSRLDEIVRLVGESAAAHLRVGRMVGEQLGVDPGTVDEIRELSRLLNELQALTMRARMVPVSTITDVLQRAVRDVARATGKEVRWEVRGDDTELDRGVLQQLADPLLHMVRNAVDHGIESPAERIAGGKPEQGVVRFHAMQLGSEVILTITDDGGGIDVESVRDEVARRDPGAANLTDDEAVFLVLRSGFSTAEFVSDISGRGVGLDVVRSNVEAVRGRIEISSELGAGTEFRIIVPITLAILPCLMVVSGGRPFAIPMHSVLLTQAHGSALSVEGRPSVMVGNQAVPLSSLATTIDLPPDDGTSIVVVAGLTRRHAFRVSELMGKRDVVVKGVSRLLPRLDVLAGASVEPDGSILFVLDVPGLIDRARHTRGHFRTPLLDASTPSHPSEKRAKILVVDDALTVRELQRSILRRAGYEVVTAVDGVDAMARLVEGPVDLVLTDVEMPRMDGFTLTETIRADASRENVPVLILTSRASEEDRQRGLVAGADGYIVKSSFDETALLQAVERLLGR